jgi:hypothetical protein
MKATPEMLQSRNDSRSSNLNRYGGQIDFPLRLRRRRRRNANFCVPWLRAPRLRGKSSVLFSSAIEDSLSRMETLAHRRLDHALIDAEALEDVSHLSFKIRLLCGNVEQVGSKMKSTVLGVGG